MSLLEYAGLSESDLKAATVQLAQRRSQGLSQRQGGILRASKKSSTAQYPLQESFRLRPTEEDQRRAEGQKPELQPGERVEQYKIAMHKWNLRKMQSEQSTAKEIVYNDHGLSNVQRSAGQNIDVSGGWAANPHSRTAGTGRFEKALLSYNRRK
jgi:hypothetical protein